MSLIIKNDKLARHSSYLFWLVAPWSPTVEANVACQRTEVKNFFAASVQNRTLAAEGSVDMGEEVADIQRGRRTAHQQGWLLAQTKPLSKPNIFIFEDVIEYLQQVYDYHGKPYRFYAEKSGFKSPSFLKEILDRKKPLTSRAIDGLIKIFREDFDMNYEEIRCFQALAEYQMSNKNEFKFEIWQNTRLKSNQIINDYEYMRQWYHVAIRELYQLCLKNKKIDPKFMIMNPEWIQQQLLYQVSLEDIIQSINFLLEKNLLLNDNSLFTNSIISKKDEKKYSAVKNYYQQSIENASQAFLNVHSNEKYFKTSVIALNQKNLKSLKLSFNNFFKRKIYSPSNFYFQKKQIKNQFKLSWKSNIKSITFVVSKNKISKNMWFDQPDTVYQVLVCVYPLTKPQNKTEQ